MSKIRPALQHVGIPVVYNSPHFVLLSEGKLLMNYIKDQFRPVQISSYQVNDG